jgi:hypothetical protein
MRKRNWLDGPMAGVDAYGEWVVSAIGSNANENGEVEEFGV